MDNSTPHDRHPPGSKNLDATVPYSYSSLYVPPAYRYAQQRQVLPRSLDQNNYPPRYGGYVAGPVGPTLPNLHKVFVFGSINREPPLTFRHTSVSFLRKRDNKLEYSPLSRMNSNSNMFSPLGNSEMAVELLSSKGLCRKTEKRWAHVHFELLVLRLTLEAVFLGCPRKEAYQLLGQQQKHPIKMDCLREDISRANMRNLDGNWTWRQLKKVRKQLLIYC